MRKDEETDDPGSSVQKEQTGSVDRETDSPDDLEEATADDEKTDDPSEDEAHIDDNSVLQPLEHAD